MCIRDSTYAPVYTDSNIDEILNCSDHITFNSLSQCRRFGQKALINGCLLYTSAMRGVAVKTINQATTLRNWIIGCYIVEYEQNNIRLSNCVTWLPCLLYTSRCV